MTGPMQALPMMMGINQEGPDCDMSGGGEDSAAEGCLTEEESDGDGGITEEESDAEGGITEEEYAAEVSRTEEGIAQNGEGVDDATRSWFEDATMDDHVVDDGAAASPEDFVEHCVQEELRQTLCRCTASTVGEAIVMVLALGMRHKISWAGMVDILRLINILFGGNVLPPNKYYFLKYVDVSPQYDVTHYGYCSSCHSYFGDRGSIVDLQCACEGGPKLDYFVIVGLQKQIEDLLKNREVAAALQYGFDARSRRNGRLHDIFDGLVYRELCKPGGLLYNNFNLTYTLNTDGIAMGKSSKQSAWPIYLVINELCPKLRAKHMILAGVWVGTSEPNMTAFLSPLKDEANSLADNEIHWSYKGQNVASKVLPLCVCVDSAARAKILNMKMCHGFFSCTFCYHKGDRVQGCIGYRYGVNNNEIPSYRTHSEIVQDMQEAYSRRNGPIKRRIVRGVKGPSPLMYIRNFDLGNMVVPDFMHILKLVKTMMLYYIDSGLIDADDVASISDRFVSISPPKSITRTPRPLSQLKLFHCNELWTWLVMYGVICMKGKLDDKYLSHFSLFSEAIRILGQKSITEEDVRRANVLLIQFVSLFESYFGLKAMTYNVHLLTHLGKFCLNYGPVWSHTCFPFEGENRHFLEMNKSPSSVADEVTRKYIAKRNISKFCDKFKVTDEVNAFCESGKIQRKYFTRSAQCVLIGRGQAVKLNAEEQTLLQHMGLGLIEVVNSFEKVIHNEIRLTTSDYSRGLKTNDSVVLLHNNIKGEINRIYEIRNDEISRVVFLIQTFVEDNNPLLQYGSIVYQGAKRVTRGDLRIVKPYDIVGQCVLMVIDGVEHVSVIPYGCYCD